MRYIFNILVILPALLLSQFAYSQVFPVQATTQLTPPYSLYLSDYVSPGSERLALNIFLADIARPNLQVKFRLRIIGQGITIETRPEYNPAPVTIYGGEPLRLISADLAEYFNPANLNFQGISRSQVERQGKLPEGVYQICFEVYEYNRGIKISNTACGVAWMILNDPPLINVPRQNEKLIPMSPQNLVFQWTPRHTGSPNSAFTTEYEFRLVEVWPETRNPNDAILTSPPIFETTTRNSMLIYGPAETPLELGRRYAFRVQAKSITGIDELDLFKNQGYSEAFTFVYGDACDLPTGILAKASSSRLNLTWDGRFNHTSYKVRYRQAGTTEWYTQNSALNEATIVSLKPSTKYEYQISGTCGWFEGDYTQTTLVQTADAPPMEYSCGLPMEVFDLDPSQLTSSLKVGDVIQAGDFDVELLKVSGSNGVFSGEGVVVMPMMNNVKVKTAFTNITVNKDLRMVNGTINVTGGGLDIVPAEVEERIAKLNETLDEIDEALDKAENLVEEVDAALAVVDQVLKDVMEYLPDDIVKEINDSRSEIRIARDEVRSAPDGSQVQTDAKNKVKAAKEKLKDGAGKALEYYAQVVQDVIRILKESIQEVIAGNKENIEKNQRELEEETAKIEQANQAQKQEREQVVLSGNGSPGEFGYVFSIGQSTTARSISTEEEANIKSQSPAKRILFESYHQVKTIIIPLAKWIAQSEHLSGILSEGEPGLRRLENQLKTEASQLFADVMNKMKARDEDGAKQIIKNYLQNF